jgi:hypothetical protein
MDYTYNLFEITSETKFEWQKKITMNKEYSHDKLGFSCFYSRTGTGKTRAQYDRIMYYKRLLKKKVTIYVPYSTGKYLPRQIYKEFKKLLKHDNIPFSRYVNKEHNHYIITIGDFECIIKQFIYNRGDPTFILDIHDDTHPIIIDEFDAIQTQFGLIHGGCTYKFAKSTLPSHDSVNNKTEFNLLERICNQTHLNVYSASLDEIIRSDLMPYVNKFNINIYVINHKRDCLDTVNIEYYTEKELYKILLRKANNNEKSFIFTSNIEHSRKTFDFLKSENMEAYECNSSTKAIDMSQLRNHNICILVNGLTRGLNNKNITNIFLFRSLKASTKANQKMMSALLNQMCGRIRNGGTIYRDVSTTTNRVVTRYDYEQGNIDNVLSVDTIFNKKLWSRLNFEHLYNNNYINNIARLFIMAYIFKNNSEIQTGGISISKDFNEVLSDDNNLNEKYIYLKKILRNKCEMTDEFITRYLNFEKEFVKIFYESYEKITGNYIKNIPISKNTYSTSCGPISNNSNSTGGGDSKPNISENEKKRAWKAMEKATSKYGGHSALINIYSDNKCLGFMHAKAKASLTNKERCKSIYAIPMYSIIELGHNCEDIRTELINFNGLDLPMTINYKYLKKEPLFQCGIYRSENEINDILKIYHYELTK